MATSTTKLTYSIYFAPSSSGAEFTTLTIFFSTLVNELDEMDDQYFFLRELYSLMTDFGITLNDETRTRSFLISNTMQQFKASVGLFEEMQEENQQR